MMHAHGSGIPAEIAATGLRSAGSALWGPRSGIAAVAPAVGAAFGRRAAVFAPQRPANARRGPRQAIGVAGCAALCHTG